MLNFFNEAINLCVRSVPDFYKGLIVGFSSIMVLFSIVKIISGKSNGKSFNYGWLIGAILFALLVVLYSNL